MSKKVTIAEVAKEAGVSIATVSRVLNRRKGKIKISEETKTTVQQAAKRLGYQADPFASALRTRRSGLFGAIIRDLRDPFLTKVFINMQEAAFEKGIELLLGHANYDVVTAGRQASIMSSLWFDGLILLGDIPGDLDVMERLLESKKPCVAVACGPRNDLPSINLDEDKGSIQALDYLYSLGHRRIACCGDPSILGVKERLLCYQDYVRERGLIQEEGYYQVCSNNQMEAAHCASELMKLPHPPTAIFCGTDLIALGVINQLHRSGKRVPEDFSVIGFDDIEEDVEMFPSLTTIRQPADVIAEHAINLILQMRNGSVENLGSTNILIQPELIIRESCCSVVEHSAALEEKENLKLQVD